ncbi:hypothetical protein [Candidatus Ruminimicrobiellum ovillum]|uniref:hypothetical protein n=1 Tax=Candidatus Ruminimicrobiellum ovillum TaxID=1947927 RepID=UPI003559F23D
MLNKIENIFTFILSEPAIKIIGLFVSFLIIFNCVFSPMLTNITTNDISAFSDVQKDVFSAVFFVSNTIEKINFSLTAKIIAGDTKTSGSKKEENKSLPCKNNDFIITSSQIQNEAMKLQYGNGGGFVDCRDLLYDYGKPATHLCTFYDEIFYIPGIILLFYASIKKLYDNILNLNINRINPAFMHI